MKRRVFAVCAAVLGGSAAAAVPAGAESVFAGLVADFLELLDQVWLVLVAFLIGMLLFSITRRVARISS